jgi:hypothetical protein
MTPGSPHQAPGDWALITFLGAALLACAVYAVGIVGGAW